MMVCLCLGFKKVLSNKSYEGELSFLSSGNKDSHPRDGTVCKVGCVLYYVHYLKVGLNDYSFFPTFKSGLLGL